LFYKQLTVNTSGQPQNQTMVHEIYFSKAGWKQYNTIGKPLDRTLLAVKKYDYQALDARKPKVTKTTLRFHDFTTFSKPGTPLKLLDVAPCLNISKNESYLVSWGNDSLTNIDKFGRGRLENAMRLAIAKEALISPLRVTNFYFEAVNETFWVFFFIADRPKAAGAKTKWYEKEPITAKEARTNLNKTVLDKGLTIFVPLEDDKNYYVVALNKSSLYTVPPYFSTPIIHYDNKVSNGYTGGSMAALGICMLLIGGVCGMALAFFMWKRNRGIAYQIYE